MPHSDFWLSHVFYRLAPVPRGSFRDHRKTESAKEMNSYAANRTCAVSVLPCEAVTVFLGSSCLVNLPRCVATGWAGGYVSFHRDAICTGCTPSWRVHFPLYHWSLCRGHRPHPSRLCRHSPCCPTPHHCLEMGKAILVVLRRLYFSRALTPKNP